MFSILAVLWYSISTAS